MTKVGGLTRVVYKDFIYDFSVFSPLPRTVSETERVEVPLLDGPELPNKVVFRSYPV